MQMSDRRLKNIYFNPKLINIDTVAMFTYSSQKAIMILLFKMGIFLSVITHQRLG